MSKATVVAMGNTNTCSYCRALETLIAKADMAALMPGADFVFADQGKDSKLYARWKAKAKMSGSIPVIAVFDSKGFLQGKFVARSTDVKPWTVAGLVSKIKAVCQACCVEGGCDDEPEATCGGCECCSCGSKIKFCPNCGKEL